MHDNSTFTPASDMPAPPAASPSSDDRSRLPFATVRRGYDPSVVDAHLAQLDESVAALRAALEESERRRAMAEQHAVAVEEEIRVVRSGMHTQPASDAGFGARAERLLRLAESEAEQIRATANRTAAEVTEQALTSAERHRHDVRKQLIAESARAEEQANHRADDLQERENALRSRFSGVQAEADAIRAAAEQAAEALRTAAGADAAELRDSVNRELARTREYEERELVRLRDLQGVAHRELGRLASTIRAELAVAPARPSPGPGRGVSRGLGPERGHGRESGGESTNVPQQRSYAEAATATP